MTRITPPSDEEVRESVARVADRILPRLRRPHPWRRRIVATGAGLGLFAAGLGVGAAAYGATLAPAATADTPFGISCYLDADSTEPASQIGMDHAALMSDPVASCGSQRDAQSGAEIEDKASTQYLVTGKAECLVISSPGSPDSYMWKSRQDPVSHELTPFWVREPGANDPMVYEGSSTKPDGFPTTCLAVTIAPDVTPPAAYGACKVDARHAAVYPLGTESVERVCRSHHLDVWTG
jgi:hypothetical protein